MPATFFAFWLGALLALGAWSTSEQLKPSPRPASYPAYVQEAAQRMCVGFAAQVNEVCNGATVVGTFNTPSTEGFFVRTAHRNGTQGWLLEFRDGKLVYVDDMPAGSLAE